MKRMMMAKNNNGSIQARGQQMRTKGGEKEKIGLARS